MPARLLTSWIGSILVIVIPKQPFLD
jgi:hypothetical protein